MSRGPPSSRPERHARRDAAYPRVVRSRSAPCRDRSADSAVALDRRARGARTQASAPSPAGTKRETRCEDRRAFHEAQVHYGRTRSSVRLAEGSHQPDRPPWARADPKAEDEERERCDFAASPRETIRAPSIVASATCQAEPANRDAGGRRGRARADRNALRHHEATRTPDRRRLTKTGAATRCARGAQSRDRSPGERRHRPNRDWAQVWADSASRAGDPQARENLTDSGRRPCARWIARPRIGYWRRMASTPNNSAEVRARRRAGERTRRWARPHFPKHASPADSSAAAAAALCA